jgi:hypothetical protein
MVDPAANLDAASEDYPSDAEATPSVASADLESENWDDPCECAIDLRDRREAQAEAARQAEAKDVGWAYETEQLLAQYIAAHSEVEAVEISSIDCRATFCEVKAIGTQDQQHAFYGVMREVRDEPWSTFGSGGASRSGQREDGRKDFDEILDRSGAATPHATSILSSASGDEGGCECATEEWQERKRAHDEAKRAAEPKDPAWAYPAEQAFHERFAAHAEAFLDFNVDCRTTYCDLRATGSTAESTSVFDELVGEVFEQRRFELTGGTGSYESGDGRSTMTMRVDRQPGSTER